MKADWSKLRKLEGMPVPDLEKEKTPDMQFRRELTMLMQESGFQRRVPLYGVAAIDSLDAPEDKKLLTDILPEARAVIFMGLPVEDPLLRVWTRIPGISMDHFTTNITEAVGLILLQFCDKLDQQGYRAVSIHLPITPAAEYKELFALSDAVYIGKNNMVILEDYGCRVNMGAIVTDAPLLHGDYRYDAYSGDGCGDCTLCEEYCPSGALKNGEYDRAKCEAYINNPDNQLQLTPHSLLKCDACMRVCPLGEVSRWDEERVPWSRILEEKSINF